MNTLCDVTPLHAMIDEFHQELKKCRCIKSVRSVSPSHGIAIVPSCCPFACLHLERSTPHPPRMHFQSHEALREGHRLQNREILREQIEPLAYMLNEDSRNGESEFEVVSTLR